MEIAEKRAAERFSATRFNGGPKHFGSGGNKRGAPAPALPGGLDAVTLMALQLKQNYPDVYGQIPLDKLREMVAETQGSAGFPVDLDPTRRR